MDQPERAARLFGAAEALWEVAGAPAAMISADHQRAVTAVKTRLGVDAFEAQRETGRAMSPEEAVAEAMEPAFDPPAQANGVSEGHRSGLSQRELDVLRLIALGRSNRDIAESLFISPRTVTTHTTGIFTKLHVGSRTAAVAVARDRELI